MGSATEDLLFKLVFSDARSKKMLIHLLNSIIVGAKDNPIRDVTIRKTELLPEYIGGKEVRLDILAEAQDGRLINVELQRQIRSYFIKRSLFHWAEVYFQQLRKGGNYSELRQTICINILEENLFKDDRFWHTYHMREDATGEILTDIAEMHFIEISKLKEYSKDSPITWWVEFIRSPHSEVVKKIGEFEPLIKEAVKMFDIVTSDPATQELMRIRNGGECDYNSAICEAKMMGKDEGRMEGRMEGRVEGRMEGMKEAALNALSMNIPLEQISKLTGLSPAEIASLKPH